VSSTSLRDPTTAAALNLNRFSRYPLLFGPSPVHPLPRLTKQLQGAEIWAKRDDCNSGLAFGGNKIRKLEYLVADALAKGADTLVTIGGVQSNHTRQVAAVAAATGLKAYLVQEHWVDWPDPLYDRVGNIQLSRILGAHVELHPAGFSIGIHESWQQALEVVVARGGKPYPIPAGASDHPLGGLGYAGFAEELERQEQELGVFFDHIIVCSVTGGTQAGMVVGFKGQRRRRKVIGIDASAKPDETWSAIARIARATAELVGLGQEITDDDVILEGAYAGEIYGIPTAETLEAIKCAARLEGMITDPVYEGKSMAGLIDMVTSGVIPRNAKVLYVHLGGSTVLSAYSALFK
jgi:1-aminocyclopropane-1-carboxylate deaminase